MKKLGGSVGGDNSGNGDREIDVAVSPISPSTRNDRPLGPVSAPGRMFRSSYSHTHNNDNGVPPVVTVSFSGLFSPRRIPNGLPVMVEDAPSSDASDVGDEDHRLRGG